MELNKWEVGKLGEEAFVLQVWGFLEWSIWLDGELLECEFLASYYPHIYVDYLLWTNTTGIIFSYPYWIGDLGFPFSFWELWNNQTLTRHQGNQTRKSLVCVKEKSTFEQD